MGPIFWIIVFIISLFALIKSSDIFTEKAEKIGLSLGMPSFVVGVTIVAIGTSLPELVSSIFAVIGGSSEIVLGNVLGSNIANIFLVLGIAAIIGKKLKISSGGIHIDLLFLIGSAFFLFLSLLDGVFSIGEGILSLLLGTIYIIYITKLSKKNQEIKKEMSDIKKEKLSFGFWIIFILSLVLIFFGAKYTIESVIQLSSIFNIAKELIAITAVALGTSLPELMVTISAARKGKPEIAIGNVLGSNIFNTLFVMGIPALIGSLTISPIMLSFGLPTMLVATLLYFFIIKDRDMTSWEGWLLLVFYIFFIGRLFNLF
ncbi:calcium/sodium antiporter [archaeon]|jgi:cation:H+ antiporter|nr:calcium/sodium antiporter [archaeon]